MPITQIIQVFSNLKRKMNWEADPEPEQAVKFRLTIATFLVLIFCVPSPWSSTQDFVTNLMSFPGLIFLNHLLMGIVIILAILKNPKESPVRRVFGILLDIISLSAVMYLAAEVTFAIFVMYLWVILGNGFRYGVKYLYLTYAISIAGFSIAITWGPV